MARPQKQTVDYFPHACKHGKTIYILEQNYQSRGYAFWFKLLEELGSHEGHFIDLNDETELEFLSAKTWFRGTETLDVLNLLAKLHAIDAKLWESKIVWCDNFIKNITDVYTKRVVSAPVKPVSAPVNPVSGGDNPQTKLKETKLKETKLKETKVNKRKDNTLATSSEVALSEHIVKILDLFKEINPMINYGNTTQRKACSELIKQFGFDSLISMVQKTLSAQGQKYCPVVATPLQLKNKIGELRIFFSKEQQKNDSLINVV